MDILALLALAAFLASAVVAAIQKAWPLALLAAGLFLAGLADEGLLT